MLPAPVPTCGVRVCGIHDTKSNKSNCTVTARTPHGHHTPERKLARVDCRTVMHPAPASTLLRTHEASPATHSRHHITLSQLDTARRSCMVSPTRPLPHPHHPSVHARSLSEPAPTYCPRLLPFARRAEAWPIAFMHSTRHVDQLPNGTICNSRVGRLPRLRRAFRRSTTGQRLPACWRQPSHRCAGGRRHSCGTTRRDETTWRPLAS